GLLRGAARSATVTALRDTVLAALGEDDFLDLVERQPRVMIEVCLKVLERAEDTRRSSPGTVLAVAVSGGSGVADVTRGLAAGLEPFGRVERLWAAKVDSILGIPHVSEVEPGDLGEVRVSRLLHDAEIEADHLILDVGDRDGRWSRRCLQMADRCLIFLPGVPDANDEAQVDALLAGCPSGLRRVVAMVHRSGSHPPSGSGVWLDRFDADEVIHVVEGSVNDLARLARVAAGRGNALVLGGGGGRGFAHIGVLRALTELGIPVDIVGGTSIGGILGAAIADAMPVDELTEWASNHFPSAMDYTIPMVSLVKGRRIARSAKQTFGDRHIEDLWRTFFCLSTDLTASRPYLHRRGSLVRALRATSAIPGVMPPVPHGDHLLVDGGVLNNLPIDVARDLAPAGKVMAADVAPPRGPGARRDYGLSVSGWAALRSRLGKRRRVYPGISAVLMRSMIVASMRERDSQVTSGLADCYLDLDMRGVSMLEFDDPASVAKRGYEAAMPILESWAASPT
ncbi:MAG: patatin-like phospholipase family protein, partial [Acidimicrobiia bacterium]